MLPATGRKVRKGFTLVELAVVVVIIGVLAAFGVPRFLRSVEKSKASEAFSYLVSVRSAQERYHAQNSIYAQELDQLDIQMPSPKYFSVPQRFDAGDTGDHQTSWMLTLTRQGASAGYGDYTVTYGQNGFIPEKSSITEWKRQGILPVDMDLKR